MFSSSCKREWLSSCLSHSTTTFSSLAESWVIEGPHFPIFPVAPSLGFLGVGGTAALAVICWLVIGFLVSAMFLSAGSARKGSQLWLLQTCCIPKSAQVLAFGRPASRFQLPVFYRCNPNADHFLYLQYGSKMPTCFGQHEA